MLVQFPRNLIVIKMSTGNKDIIHETCDTRFKIIQFRTPGCSLFISLYFFKTQRTHMSLTS